MMLKSPSKKVGKNLKFHRTLLLSGHQQASFVSTVILQTFNLMYEV